MTGADEEKETRLMVQLATTAPSSNGGGVPATRDDKAAAVRWNATRHGISSPAPVEPPKATPARVEGILSDPPAWLAGSSLRGSPAAHSSSAALAFAVVARPHI